MREGEGCDWALSSLVSSISADRAIIFQFSRDYKSAKLVAYHGFRIPTGHPTELVWENSIEPLLREEFLEGTNVGDKNPTSVIVDGMGACSYLYSPITIGSIVWGLVGVHQNEPRGWTTEERTILQGTSLHIGNIFLKKALVENAALHSKIRKSKMLLQRVVDSTPIFLAVKNAAGKFILVNKALSEAAGYTSPKDMIGEEEWGDYFPPDSIEEETRVLTTGKEIVTLSAKGKDRVFSTIRKYVEGDNVLPSMVVSTLVDITDFSIVTKRLEDFTYIASHDLQEPLRTITSFLGLLKKRHGNELSGSALSHVDTAIDASKRMGDLLSDLLTYSRLGGKPKLFKMVSLADILMKALRNISGKLTFEVCPTIMYDPNSLPDIWGDEVQLIACMQNLLSNAIKFGQGSPIEIAHISSSTHWEIKVVDYGVGVPEGMEEAIFKPFKRAHSNFEGTGMGLAIVEKVAHMHQGEAWVTKTPGGGTTVHVTIKKP